MLRIEPVARFITWLVATYVCAAHLWASPDSAYPSGFYIVSVGFSDALPGWHRSVLEVRKEGPDVLVRYIRVMPFSNDCGEATKIVWIASRLPNTSLSTLTGGQNFCDIKSSDLARTLQKFPQRRRMIMFAGDTFSITAKCGADTRVIRLPADWTFNMARLQRQNPKTAALWTLENTIGKRVFGSFPSIDVIPADLAPRLQLADEAVLDELKSGKFDAGLPAGKSFKEDVAALGSTTDPPGARVQLVDAGRFRFDQYSEPQYPPLARQAQISGTVELQLAVDRDTGIVRDVKVLSGQAILAETAREAALHWRFAPGSADEAGFLRIALEYLFRCP
jgi:TonB family protein